MFLYQLFDGVNWLADNTFGLLFKGIFWLLDLILPSKYCLVITEYGDLFWNGIKNTMAISLVGTILGFVIAVIFGSLRTIKVKPKDTLPIKIVKKAVNYIVKIYVTVFRGTPMMVQAMIIYYGLYSLFGWAPVQASFFIVTINTGAYLTEVIRDGILSVDPGQAEAARSLGFSKLRTNLLIIYPQAIKNCMAAIGNEFVINIKDTSVLNVIGCAEMFYIVKMSTGKDYNFTEQMIVAALIYLILTLSVTSLLKAIEKKMSVPLKELPGSN